MMSTDVIMIKQSYLRICWDQNTLWVWHVHDVPQSAFPPMLQSPTNQAKFASSAVNSGIDSDWKRGSCGLSFCMGVFLKKTSHNGTILKLYKVGSPTIH